MRTRWDNREIVTVGQVFIFKWRFSCRLRHHCENSLLHVWKGTGSSTHATSALVLILGFVWINQQFASLIFHICKFASRERTRKKFLKQWCPKMIKINFVKRLSVKISFSTLCPNQRVLKAVLIMLDWIVFCFFADINECESDSKRCSSNAECVNNEGSYQCICRQGYEVRGAQCRGNLFLTLEK